ncbi:Leucine rich repeat-containing protein [Pseudobutyrivibrio sp. OR37]|uniref:leucine-rich repeat domain-containing protein n=1 Tax=Pseudobutyrivibrio sp. OR37 TaxID=1798186 RepID=UPI0008F1DDEB|nr:leucine-rich repeat domain-containing protein [Pseudobutyrivibrio sp. OR37]SFH99105.1 Leucine rich repeat-containing protein [Pseudobutyrivibrio sp. OR37]
MKRLLKNLVPRTLSLVLIFCCAFPSTAVAAVVENQQMNNEVISENTEKQVDSQEISNENSNENPTQKETPEELVQEEEQDASEIIGDETGLDEEVTDNEADSEKASDEESEEDKEAVEDDLECVPLIEETSDLEPEELQIIENINPQKLLNASTETVSGIIKGTNIKWELSNGTLTITGKGAIPGINISNGTSLPPWFSESETRYFIPSISRLVIGEGITSIGKYVFLGISPDEVKLPSTLRTINGWAFYDSTIDSIDFPNGLTTIGERAFYKATIKSRLVFPKTLTSIGKYAFSEVEYMRTVEFTGNMPAMADCAFAREDIIAYYPADNKTYSEAKRKAVENRFHSVTWKPVAGGKTGTSVTQGTCGNGVNWKVSGSTLTISGKGRMYDYSMDNKAPWYEYGDALRNIDIQEGVTYIGAMSFVGTKNINLKLATSVKEIGISAFYRVENLSISPTTFSGVEKFDKNAFYYTYFQINKLANDGTLIDLSSAKTIDDYAFYSVFANNQGTLKLGKNVTRIGNYAFYSESPNSKLNMFGGEFKLPEGIQYIGDYAFANNGNYNGNLKIPNSVKVINEGAFSGCLKVTSIDVGDGVTTIYPNAFYGLSNLTKIRFGKNVKNIGSKVLSYSTKQVDFYGSYPVFDSQWFYGSHINADMSVRVYSKDPSWNNITKDDLFLNAGKNIDFIKDGNEITIIVDLSNCKDYSPQNIKTVYHINKGDTFNPPFLYMKTANTDTLKSVSYWSTDIAGTKVFSATKPVLASVTIYPQFKDKLSKSERGDLFSDEILDMGFSSEADIPKGLWVYDKKSSINNSAAEVQNRYYYTGSAVKLNKYIKVYHHTTLLVAGKDYTIKYKNNVNAGTATAIITGKGDFKGTYNYDFKIEPLNLSKATFGKFKILYNKEEVTKITQAYNGKVQKPKVSVAFVSEKDDSVITLKEGRDYTITFPGTDKKVDGNNYNEEAFKEAGKYKAVITGKNNVEGTLNYTVEITNKIPLSKCTSLAPATVDFVNNQENAALLQYEDLKYNNRLLKKYVDYSVQQKWSEDGKVLTLTYKALAASQFFGSFQKKVNVKGYPFSKVYVLAPTPEQIKSKKYSRNVYEYSSFFKVYPSEEAYKYGYGKLKEGNLYDYMLKNDVEFNHIKGTATFTLIPSNGVEGDYMFNGIKKVTVKLNNPDVANSSQVSVSMDGFNPEFGESDVNAKLKVTVDGKLMKGAEINPANSDKWAKGNNKKIHSGEYPGIYYDDFDYYFCKEFDKANRKIKITIIGNLGHMQGKKIFTYSYGKYDIAKDYEVKAANEQDTFAKPVRVTIKSNSPGIYTPNGSTFGVQSIRTYDKASKKQRVLNPSTDYSVSYSENFKTGNGRATITGKGLYTGKIVYDYKLVKRDVNASPLTSDTITNIVANPKGGFIAPEALLYVGNSRLVSGRDYDKKFVYNYYNNNKVGAVVGANDKLEAGTKIMVTVNMKGNYTGSIKKVVTVADKNIGKAKQDKITLEINPKTRNRSSEKMLTANDIKLKYNGEPVPANAYKILNYTYKNNIKRGTASVMIIGDGQYGGYYTVNYTLTAKDISK